MKTITEFSIRKAILSDKNTIESVMKRSMELLGQGYYSPEQVQSSLRYVCVPDEQIIEDGTYYVIENQSGMMLACGGWSFRKKHYAGPNIQSQDNDKLDPKEDKARIRAMFVLPNLSGKGLGTLILKTAEQAAKAYGFNQGTLGATESGLAFYKLKGWHTHQENKVTLPDGVQLKITHMEKNF